MSLLAAKYFKCPNYSHPISPLPIRCVLTVDCWAAALRNAKKSQRREDEIFHQTLDRTEIFNQRASRHTTACQKTENEFTFDCTSFVEFIKRWRCRPLKCERGYVVFVARSSPLSVEQSDHAFNVAKERTNEGPIATATATDPTAAADYR